MAMTNNNKKGLNVPPLRFPEFKGEWITERIGTDCDVRMCKRIFASQTNPTGGVPFYKIGTIGGKPDSYISKELFEKYKSEYNYPKAGEVMLTCAGTIGRCFQYDGSPSYFQDSNIVWIDNPKEKITNDFLFYALQRHDWRELNTTTITRLYNDDIRNIDIVYPQKKKEQEKICRLILLIDRRIDVQRKTIEELENTKDTLFRAIFEDASNEKIALGDVLVESTERTTRIHEYTVLSSTVKGIFQQEEYFKRQISSQNDIGYKVLRRNQIVFSPQNLWMGNINLNETFDVGMVSPSYKVYSLCGKVSPVYMAGLLKSSRMKYEYSLCSEQGASVVRRNLDIEAFLQIAIPIPSKSAQAKAISILSTLESRISIETKELFDLESVKQYLLSNLLI